MQRNLEQLRTESKHLSSLYAFVAAALAVSEIVCSLSIFSFDVIIQPHSASETWLNDAAMYFSYIQGGGRPLLACLSLSLSLST